MKHTIEELTSIAPRITEHFGMPIELAFNYSHKFNVWNILENKLIIRHVHEDGNEFLFLCIWLESDYMYTGQWTIAKCPLDGDMERFIRLVETVRNIFIEAGDIFPCTVE